MRLVLAVLALFPSLCFAAGNDVAVEQRNAANSGWVTRLMASPATDGILIYNKTTLLPQWVTLGSGLAISSGVLIPTQADWAAVSGPSVILNKPAIPDAQVQTDWNATTGLSVLLNKPSLSAVATSGAYADLSGTPSIPAAQVNSDWNAGSGVAQILNKPILSTVATTGSYTDLSNKPTIPTEFSVGSPTSRNVSLATAYQCTNTARPCSITITLQAQSSVSLSGASNNEGAVTIGSTSGVATGTGTNIATYKNNLGGTLVIGLNLNSQQANTYSVLLPAGWYFAVRQTAGSGLEVVSAFDQAL
ncbi:TPA: hypothetical protein L6B67_02590 [Pseudomonas aeruginosa]|nr:hypothetical protein [Pseudomonas aeruginosa]